MRQYGITLAGETVHEYVLANELGMEVRFITYGGIISSIRVPDRHGQIANVALGFDNLADYEADHPYFGAITGRFANRIAGGRFKLDGVDYQLPLNDGPNCLHGGERGFDKRVWEAEQLDENQVELYYTSADGEEGFPGNLRVKVYYSLHEGENALQIDYAAITDAPTILNLTNHSYFNLLGEGEGSIEDHILSLNASHYTPTDADQIPSGDVEEVDGTPFDFQLHKTIAAGLRASHPQIVMAQGFDHNFVINRERVDEGVAALAAEVYEPRYGRRMEVWTTEPGIQFYSGNFLDGTLVGASGRVYRQGDGLALETQHFPNSPNESDFPSTVLRPGEEFLSTTLYRFSAD